MSSGTPGGEEDTRGAIVSKGENMNQIRTLHEIHGALITLTIDVAEKAVEVLSTAETSATSMATSLNRASVRIEELEEARLDAQQKVNDRDDLISRIRRELGQEIVDRDATIEQMKREQATNFEVIKSLKHLLGRVHQMAGLDDGATYEDIRELTKSYAK